MHRRFAERLWHAGKHTKAQGPITSHQLHHITSHQSKGWQRFPSFLTKISQSTRARWPPNAIATCRFPPTLHSCVTGTAPSFSCHSSRASEPNRQPIFEYVFILPMCAPYLQELHWLDQSRRGDMEQRLRRHWRKRCFLENESAAMCAYCRAPRIILRQGATRGSSPWLLSPYCTVAASRLQSHRLYSLCKKPLRLLHQIRAKYLISNAPSVPKPLGAPVLPREPQDKRVDRHIDACRTSASHHTPSSV